ncbi:MAG: hypothetical protein DI546_04290 [Rhizobium sp.]|nr:MAG: hypothetical protein DI546_04290 [Rhizobium sp.]
MIYALAAGREMATSKSKGDGGAVDNARYLPKSEQDLKLRMIEALARTIHLHQMKISDVNKRHRSWRNSHVAAVKGMRAHEFGTQALTYAIEQFDVTPVCHFVPPAPPSGTDGKLEPLFTSLRTAAEACDKALPEIGARTYPLAQVSCESARLACYLAIEAIRKNPHFVGREVNGFAVQLSGTIALLERAKGKSAAVNRAIQCLGKACAALEDLTPAATSTTVSAGSHAYTA